MNRRNFLGCMFAVGASGLLLPTERKISYFFGHDIKYPKAQYDVGDWIRINSSGKIFQIKDVINRPSDEYAFMALMDKENVLNKDGLKFGILSIVDFNKVEKVNTFL